MKINSPSLFIEINNLEYIFAVGDENEQNNFNLIYKCIVPIQGIENFKITDFDLVFNDIKKNIYFIEQKLNYTFKNLILILNNFNCSFINLSGFTKLNGSQILKENITYILNSLKSNIIETEEKKTILHIFNSKYVLDKKKVENLPIGLFGDFYSHELSFCLINNNDYKNLYNIFNSCNLKIKKVLLKSFVEGTLLSDKNLNLNTFFKIKINEDSSQIFYFENDALKFEQKFNFGSELILKDISKVTSLNLDTVNKILNGNKFNKDISNVELLKKDLFKNIPYRKIKKKLIFDIAEARIKELSEIMITKNINFLTYQKKDSVIFFTVANKNCLNCFEETFFLHFSNNDYFSIKYLEDIPTEQLMENVNGLVHFGWKKEAIPVIQAKKSILARFFDALFKFN